MTAIERALLRGVSGEEDRKRLRKDLGQRMSWLATARVQKHVARIRRNTEPARLKSDAEDYAIGLGHGVFGELRSLRPRSK